MIANRFVLSLACAAFGTCSVASAQSSGSLNSMDKKFLMEAAQGGNFELASAKLATQKASSEDVKKYAQKLVDDHEQLDPQLKSFATAHNTPLAKGMEADDKAVMMKLKNLSGTAFDKAYIKSAKDINSEDMQDEQKELENTNNTQLKELVQKMKDSDAAHENMAQNLKASE